MSKHETPLTECFWQTCANGAFIPEYPLVRRGDDCAQRLVDAVILPDEPHRRANVLDYPSLLSPWVSILEKANKAVVSLSVRLRLGPKSRVDPRSSKLKGPPPSAYDLLRRHDADED